MPLAIGSASKGATSTGTSVATTAVNTTATGSIFVVAVTTTNDMSVINTPTDTFGNTYTPVENVLTPTLQTQTFHAVNGVGGTSHQVTATISGATGLTALFLEVTGADTTAPGDGDVSIEDDATPFTSPSIVTTNADDALIGFMGGSSTTAGSTFGTSGASPASGWTIPAGSAEEDGSLYWSSCFSHQIVAATGTYNAGFSQLNSAIDNSVGLHAYKALAEAPQYAAKQRRMFMPGRGPDIARFTRRRANAYTQVNETIDASGDLPSAVATMAGNVEVNIGASGSLVSPAAVLAGTLSVSVDASGGLAAQSSAASGTVGVTVGVSGGLAAQACSLAGTVAVNIGASGSLVSSAAAISGSVAVNIDTSGALAAAASTLAGTVSVNVGTSGSLAAGSGSLSGSVTVGAATSGPDVAGDFKSTASDASGTVAVRVDVSGSPSSQPATMIGAAGIIITVSGSLVSAISRAAGNADTSHSTSGGLVSQRPVMAGTATVRNDLSGSLLASQATIAGNADIAVMPRFTGALQTQPSRVSGSAVWSVSMSGGLQAQSSKVDLTLTKTNQGSETGAHHRKGHGGRFLEFFVRRKT